MSPPIRARFAISPTAALAALALGLLALALTATRANAIVALEQYADPGAASTEGQLNQPSGVVVAPNGDVYIAEDATRRVSVFANDGSFLRAFGKDVVPGNAQTGLETCSIDCKEGEAGGEAGALDDPHGIARDSGGNLYVPETTNARVSVFTAQGAFLRAFGKDVVPGNTQTGFEICTAACQAGSLGQGAGEFTFPAGVTVHGNLLYVGDFGNSRVGVYTLGGAFLRAFGKDVLPGNLNSGFEVCTSLCKTGVEGDGPGEFEAPLDLATDVAGNVYVADSFNNRISIFSPQPAFLRAFGRDVVPGNPGGGFEVCTTACQRGSGVAAAGALTLPLGVAVGATGPIYVGDQFNNRVSVFRRTPSFSQAFGADVVPGNARRKLETCVGPCKSGLDGTDPGELRLPSRLAVDCRGAVYVVDPGNHRVQKFGRPGTASPPCPAS